MIVDGSEECVGEGVGYAVISKWPPPRRRRADPPYEQPMEPAQYSYKDIEINALKRSIESLEKRISDSMRTIRSLEKRLEELEPKSEQEPEPGRLILI